MIYLLDTNVVSELRRPQPDGAVLAWIASVDEADLHLSAATLGEIRTGIETTRNQDGAKATKIERWLGLMANAYNVLPMDGPPYRMWARLMRTRSDTLNKNAMIAATARLHELPVVTRNVADFAGFGVTVPNPFELSGA